MTNRAVGREVLEIVSLHQSLYILIPKTNLSVFDTPGICGLVRETLSTPTRCDNLGQNLLNH